MGSRWAYSPWPYVLPLSGRVRTWPSECKVQGRVSSCLGLKVGTLREEEESDDGHFMCMCVHTEPCPTLCDPMDCSPPGSSVHGIVPGKNTGVGSHFFLQKIFLTQGSNLHLLHWQVNSLPLCCLGSVIILQLWANLRRKHKLCWSVPLTSNYLCQLHSLFH